MNREAATKLAALEASQVERERGFEARIKELVEAKEALSAQFAEISNKLLAEAQETFLQARRPALPAIRGTCRPEPEGAAPARPRAPRALRDHGPEGRGGAPRRIRDAVGPDRSDADWDRAGLGRGGQAGQCASQRAEGEGPLGRAAASQRPRELRTVGALRFRDGGQRHGRRGRPPSARTSSSGFRAASRW